MTYLDTWKAKSSTCLDQVSRANVAMSPSSAVSAVVCTASVQPDG